MKSLEFQKLLPELRIRIDFSSKDAGLSTLLSERVMEWIHTNSEKGRNLVQTCAAFRVDKPSILCLRAIPQKSWDRTPSWNKVLCRTYSKNVKGTPCKIGKSRKMFIKVKGTKNYAGFGAYVKHLQSLSKGQATYFHKNVVKQLGKIFGNKKIYVHGEDVDWFHLKANKKIGSKKIRSKKIRSKKKAKSKKKNRSRRKCSEERALEKCRSVIDSFADCSKEHGFMVGFRCREQNRRMKACLVEQSSDFVKEIKKFR